MNKIFVKPRALTDFEKKQYPDLKCAIVRQLPEQGGHPLALEGELVPDSTYWLRRIKAGDVLRVTKPANTSTKRPKSVQENASVKG